jgi:hypothetical protein
MFDRKPIAILIVLLLPHCTTVSQRSRSADQRDPESVNATADTSAVAVETGQPPRTIPMLAIEVEVTADGIRPIGATIVQAPRIANSAVADLRVQAGGVLDWIYTMPDPRFVEGTDGDERRDQLLESARGYVYAPLLAAVTTLSIQPLAGGRDDGPITPRGSIDVRPLAEELCRRTQSKLPVCREILSRSR